MTSGATIREDVARAFGSLMHDNGFTLNVTHHDPRAFGNAVVVLESEMFSIQVIRDRSQVFVDVSSARDPGRWFPLHRVIEAIGGKEPAGPVELEHAAFVIGAHLPRLVESMGATRYKETRRELERLGEIEEAARLKSLEPPR